MKNTDKQVKDALIRFNVLNEDELDSHLKGFSPV